MKLIFALKSPPFYENIPLRKSYISIVDGVIKDDIETIRKNRDNYLNQFFPSKEEQDKITDEFNYMVDSATERTITVNVNNFNGVYPNDFEFWNNVNYVKIIHSEKFVEYCYIRNRSCDNISVNLWTFTFFVDRYNTYWDKVYQAIINSGVNLDVVRYHENPFVSIKYEDKEYLTYKFLTTQNTAFWNKEDFESGIKSVIPVDSGKSLTPWNEYKVSNDSIIKVAKTLWQAYKNYFEFGTGDELPFFSETTNGFLSLFFEADENDKEKPWEDGNLSSYNGLVNSYWVLPIINDGLLNTDETGNGTISSLYPKLKKIFDDKNKSLIWLANLIKNTIDATRTAAIIQTPKPILLYNIDLKNGEEDITWNHITYPIRTRGIFAENNGKKINEYKQEYNKKQVIFKINDKEYNGVVLSELKRIDRVSRGDDNFANLKHSLINTLADERIPADIIVDKLILKGNELFQDVNSNLEPKLYDEELTNIIYSHYNNQGYTISLRWYFFNNFEDLIKWKSIFLFGYQFTQPHIVGLIQYVNSGLYANKNLSANTSLVSFFAPNQQSTKSAQKEFLNSNRNSMNTALNNQRQNRDLGIVGSVIGAATGTVIGGSMVSGSGIGAIGSVIAGGLANAIFGSVKSITQYDQFKASQQAKLADLANTPNATSDPLNESSFKLLNSYDGFYTFNMPSEQDKEKIAVYHRLHGYYYGKQLEVKSLANRLYYDFWQINQLKVALGSLDILDEYKEYFELLFENGLTFFHENIIVNGEETKVKVGDYSKENWPVEIWDKLIKGGTEIKMDKEDVKLYIGTQKPVITVKRKIENWDDLVEITTTVKDENIAETTIVNEEKSIIFGGKSVGETTVTISAKNGIPVDIKIIVELIKTIQTDVNNINLEIARDSVVLIENYRDLINLEVVNNNTDKAIVSYQNGVITLTGKEIGTGTVTISCDNALNKVISYNVGAEILIDKSDVTVYHT